MLWKPKYNFIILMEKTLSKSEYKTGWKLNFPFGTINIQQAREQRLQRTFWSCVWDSKRPFLRSQATWASETNRHKNPGVTTFKTDKLRVQTRGLTEHKEEASHWSQRQPIKKTTRDVWALMAQLWNAEPTLPDLKGEAGYIHNCGWKLWQLSLSLRRLKN